MGAFRLNRVIFLDPAEKDDNRLEADFSTAIQLDDWIGLKAEVKTNSTDFTGILHVKQTNVLDLIV